MEVLERGLLAALESTESSRVPLLELGVVGAEQLVDVAALVAVDGTRASIVADEDGFDALPARKISECKLETDQPNKFVPEFTFGLNLVQVKNQLNMRCIAPSTFWYKF